MNFGKIVEVLKEYYHSVYSFVEDSEGEDVEIANIGKIIEVNRNGAAGEDIGSWSWYCVKHFVDQKVYIRVDGYYTSYNGLSFEGGWGSLKEVFPKEKVVTVWE